MNVVVVLHCASRLLLHQMGAEIPRMAERFVVNILVCMESCNRVVSKRRSPFGRSHRAAQQ
jgi:hypothetical protein